MTQQTNGMPDLEYSEETFRDMYEALKLVKQWQNDPEMFMEEIAPMINKALAKAEGK